MITRLCIVFAAFLLPAQALAQEGLEGAWDLRISDTTIFRFDISEGENGEWLGIWYKPESFRSDGNNFGRLRGGVETQASMAGIEFLGDVELSFEDPRPGAVPDIFRFELLDHRNVRMTYVGTDLAPYALVRAEDGDAIGEWEESRVYRRPMLSDVTGNVPSSGDELQVRPDADRRAAGPGEPPETGSGLGMDFLDGL